MRDRPRHPLIIARGGASAEAPEHTIAAFELALERGADGLELDVHLTRDTQLVVIRDFTLERTTDGAGPLNEHSVRELKRLDAGGWRGRAFRGQRIQTLEEVLERFRGRTRFWITVRGGADLYRGIEERVASTLEIYDVLGETLVQSLDYRLLDRMRVMGREFCLGAVVDAPPVDPGPHAAAGRRAVSADAVQLTEAAVGAIRKAGLDCYAWTHDEPVLEDRLVDWNVSGVITGHPGRFSARLGP